MIFLAGRQRVEFQNFEAKEISQFVWEAGVRRDVVFVDEACVKSSDERAAVLDVKFQAVGVAAGKHMKRRRKNDFVFRQILGRLREIHWNVAIMQRIVNKLNMFAQAEKFI